MNKATNNNAGVFQLENGYWGYRFVITVNGKKKAQKRVKDEEGKPFKTEKQALKARNIAIAKAHVAKENHKENSQRSL